ALTYGMISNFFVLIGTNFGERLMYVPSVFFVLLVACAVARLPLRALVATTALLSVLGATRSIAYAIRWNDRASFYQWAAERHPKSIRLRMLMVAEAAASGQLEQAANLAAAARELEPEYDEVWIQSAEIAERRGRYDEAENDLRRAIAL